MNSGYVVIKNVFEPELLYRCREEILNFIRTEKTLQNSGGIAIPDFVSRNLLITSSLKEHPNMKKILTSIFGGDNYRFCSHNDIGINRVVGWHKDKLNGEYSKYQKKDIWGIHEGERHEIYKVGIYLQDHSNDNCALKICPGTHLQRNMVVSNPVQLRPGFGDVVIFDQRITHRGMNPDEKKKCDEPRIMISFGFGKNNIFTDEFEEGTIARQNAQNKMMNIIF